MADLQAAKRYAQAAFEIAVQDGTIDAWRSSLADIATVLTDSSAADVFADARIPVDQRVAMVGRALDIPEKPLNLARVLVSKGRSHEARGVSEAFNRMADERAGIAHAQITTAVSLSPEELTAIESRLTATTGKTISAVAVVDPAIIGGVVVRVGDELIDGSVRTRLKRLRRELEGAR
jgi:F-type H+-transporting ATPase subunit delta